MVVVVDGATQRVCRPCKRHLNQFNYLYTRKIHIQLLTTTTTTNSSLTLSPLDFTHLLKYRHEFNPKITTIFTYKALHKTLNLEVKVVLT